MLTERQQKAREGKMTGSRVATVVTGTDEDKYNLWLELTGDPSWKGPDYSNDFQVQLGNFTEQFHLDWIQRHTGLIEQRGTSLQHPKVEWAAYTLDGWATDHDLPVEAKHVGGYELPVIIIERYMPQIHWGMFCGDTDEAIFSVIAGTKEPRPVFIGRDQEYLDKLVDRAAAFMNCVHELREPVPNPFLKAPKPIYSRIVDMTGNNAWATAASRWKENLEAHKAFDFAAKEIKATVPEDAKECFGHGIRVKRNKTGALTIKEDKDDAEQD